MFIELAEHIRCIKEHETNSPCVLVPGQMAGRRVLDGVVACPVCRTEYRVERGILRLGAVTAPGNVTADRVDVPLPDPPTLQALLGVAAPGGYVVLLGTAARTARALGAQLDGVELVAVDPPPDVESAGAVSVIIAPRVPLRAGVARGVVVGASHVSPLWLREAARVVVRYGRLVVQTRLATIEGVEALTAGDGVWVGEKRS